MCLVGRKLRDDLGRHTCHECLAPRGTPHATDDATGAGRCSFVGRHASARVAKVVLVRFDKGNDGKPVPVVFWIPKSQNEVSARLVRPDEVPRWRAMEDKRRARKQRRAMKERAARDERRAA